MASPIRSGGIPDSVSSSSVAPDEGTEFVAHSIYTHTMPLSQEQMEMCMICLACLRAVRNARIIRGVRCAYFPTFLIDAREPKNA